MTPSNKPIYFVSYAHEDRDWRTLLFERSIGTTVGDCLVWSDDQLRGGDHWRDEIRQQLGRCSVAVLLVSPHFLASSFIAQDELPEILARAALPAGDARRLRVVAIPVGDGQQALAASTDPQHRRLAELQYALATHPGLPARPRDCQPATLEAVRQLVQHELQAAVDPLGADLQQRLARRFTGLQWLGEGSRAQVYQARDTQLNRTVAIKALRDLRQREAFRGDVLAALRTSGEPSFVMVYDAEFGASSSWCVVQHVQGQSLRSLLRAWAQPGASQPDADQLRQLFIKLARALERAHCLGLRYGNLKPSNIMVDAQFEPFILPAGRQPQPGQVAQDLPELLARVALAQQAGAPADDAAAEDLAYLVPEQAVGLEQADDGELADQYMLGLLAWEMATGALPQRLTNPRRLAEDGLDAFAPLPPVRSRRRLFPERFDTLLQTMAQADPAARLQPDPARRGSAMAAVLAEPDLHDDLSLVLVRDSWRRCTRAADFDSRFFSEFYARLVQRKRAAAKLLARIQGPDRWQRQHRMLKQAVSLLIAFSQRQADRDEPTLLSHVAASHAGMPAGLYAPFGELLVDMVCGHADADPAQSIAACDPVCQHRDTARRLRGHWQRVLAPGIDYLTRAELLRDAEMTASLRAREGVDLYLDLGARAPGGPVNRP
ncbi:protein kinase domain-containing protein [Pseudaquabacterium pictum]|uniref:Uncharacterized protein n=1 Tax=Pseudaquabacterium pictum TaxID=2315236 RepID=A0A480AKP9_9BURK|nr:TIR domain-containing protein [Rubrivivax pictus]GCL62184.1 hypothetical protein AQPW35_12650 [Rubrivivax pictus]